jgi:hypothetical protein
LRGYKTKKTARKFVEILLFSGKAKKPFDILKLEKELFEGLKLMAKDRGLSWVTLLLEIWCDALGLAIDHPGRKEPVISESLKRQRASSVFEVRELQKAINGASKEARGFRLSEQTRRARPSRFDI